MSERTLYRPSIILPGDAVFAAGDRHWRVCRVTDELIPQVVAVHVLETAVADHGPVAERYRRRHFHRMRSLGAGRTEPAGSSRAFVVVVVAAAITPAATSDAVPTATPVAAVVSFGISALRRARQRPPPTVGESGARGVMAAATASDFVSVSVVVVGW